MDLGGPGAAVRRDLSANRRKEGKTNSDRRGGPALRLEFPSERFDVTAADLEQAQVASVAERHELAEVQGVCVTGETPVAAQEPGQRNVFRIESTLRSKRGGSKYG